MELLTIVDKSICLSNFAAKNKDAALRSMAEIAAKSDAAGGLNADMIFNSLNEREKQGSTGFGDGVAIPHTRIKGFAKFLLFILVSPKGIEFDALDNKKVNLFFVMLGPEEAVNEHLQVLATLSRMLSAPRFKRELLGVHTKDALYETFAMHCQGGVKECVPARKMKMLYVILYIEEFLYDILQFLIQEGVEGATIVESFGMGEYISNIPLFASFIGFMREDKNQSRTIMALIPSDDQDKIVAGIEEITGDLDKKQGAMILIQDIGFYKGTMKML